MFVFCFIIFSFIIEKDYIEYSISAEGATKVLSLHLEREQQTNLQYSENSQRRAKQMARFIQEICQSIVSYQKIIHQQLSRQENREFTMPKQQLTIPATFLSIPSQIPWWFVLLRHGYNKVASRKAKADITLRAGRVRRNRIIAMARQHPPSICEMGWQRAKGRNNVTRVKKDSKSIRGGTMHMKIVKGTSTSAMMTNLGPRRAISLREHRNS